MVRTHLASAMTLNNYYCEMIAERSYIFRWRSCWCWHCVCLNSLLPEKWNCHKGLYVYRWKGSKFCFWYFWSILKLGQNLMVSWKCFWMPLFLHLNIIFYFSHHLQHSYKSKQFTTVLQLLRLLNALYAIQNFFLSYIKCLKVR